jgi:hypothetical protein
MNRKIRLIWDFHGADSKGTAEHHVKHLEQFMEREKLEMLRTAVYFKCRHPSYGLHDSE